MTTRIAKGDLLPVYVEAESTITDEMLPWYVKADLSEYIWGTAPKMGGAPTVYVNGFALRYLVDPAVLVVGNQLMPTRRCELCAHRAVPIAGPHYCSRGLPMSPHIHDCGQFSLDRRTWSGNSTRIERGYSNSEEARSLIREACIALEGKSSIGLLNGMPREMLLIINRALGNLARLDYGAIPYFMGEIGAMYSGETSCRACSYYSGVPPILKCTVNPEGEATSCKDYERDESKLMTPETIERLHRHTIHLMAQPGRLVPWR